MIGSSDSDSEDDKRVIRSAKDRRFDELQATCHEIRVSAMCQSMLFACLCESLLLTSSIWHPYPLIIAVLDYNTFDI